MKVGILFSGGKDSNYATYLAKQEGHQLACLISVMSENPDSYMFHTPSIEKVRHQSEVMEIPLVIGTTKGKKEEELKDLEELIRKARDEYQIDGLVTGALHSVYQASRIQKICDVLGLECINPLWHKDEFEYWQELFENSFEIMIIGVASDGLDQKWLGRMINKEDFLELKRLKDKFKFHLAFEGGEAETFVLDCPLFHKKLKILRGEKTWDGNSGRYIIQEIELVDK